MKRALILLMVILLNVLLLAGEITPREVIIKTRQPLSVRGTRTGIGSLDTFLQSKSVRELKKIQIPDFNYYVAYLGEDITRAEIEALNIRGIEYIQPNNLNSFYRVPNDTYFYSQELSAVQLRDAWDIETGNENITIAVIDSGILRAHPDLQGRCRLNYGEDADGDGFVMNPLTGEYDPGDLNGIDDDGNGFVDDICGWDFSDAPELEEIALGDYYEQDNDPTDENYHGTHVSGIICANTNNGIGVAGINWKAKILSVRAGFRTLEGTGYLQDDDAAAAIIYAANMGANVINLSWGDSEYSPIIGDACEYAYEKGSIIIASAGNTPEPVLSYPARLAHVISVGSIGRNNTLSGFSSYGPDLDLVAPGEIIKSTYSNGTSYTYYDQSGTSMAAPHVAGCISLLLSRHPDLSYEDVRAKLLASCDDLGSNGKDDMYGYGRLNAYRLLQESDIPYIQLYSPEDNVGYSQGFPIIGTISSEDFLSYNIMYSSLETPSQLDWKDIVTHNNAPTEFTEEVFNDTIAYFDFLPELPDGDYRIKIEISDRNFDTYDVIRNVRLDRTSPIVDLDSIMLYPRYDAENMNYFLQALYNEKVVLVVDCRDMDDNVYMASSAYPSALQTVKLPSNIPENLYFLSITATNICGQSSTIQYMANIQYHSASINGWTRKVVGEGIVAIPKVFDFNNNGIPEVVAMHLVENSYDNVSCYELGDTLSVTHSFNSSFWPYDIGDSNESGLEVLGLNLDTIYMFEAAESEQYPGSTSDWNQNGSAGAFYQDIDFDGIDELLLLKNEATERIWEIHERSENGDGFQLKTRLRNTSTTTQRNSYVPLISSANLDNDPYKDILTADTEGDIMIFELMGNEESYDPVWQFKFAVPNTYYLTTGDFTGDGRADFVVAGYNDDPYNSNNNFWYVELFSKVDNDQYEPISHILFDRKESKNSIYKADTNSDGDMELILGFSPDLYIVDFLDNKLTPIWRGDCSWAYRIVPIERNGTTSLLVNDVDEDENVLSVLYSPDYSYVENVTVPQNFRLSLTSGSTSSLTWKSVTGAEYYNVYRKGDGGEWTIPVTTNSFTDPDLVYGVTYEYAVSAVDTDQSPSESHLTSWKKVIPDPEPVLESITMTGLNELTLVFDKQLSSDAYNIGFYSVDQGIGKPHSVNILNDRKMLLLRFSGYFNEQIPTYHLTIKNLQSDMGVPIQLITAFDFVYDVQSPYVTGCEIVSNRKIDISFNEELRQSDIEMLSNFVLSTPLNDSENSIVSVVYTEKNQEKVAEITLAKNIVSTMEPYFIMINDVRDLAGNYILKTRNLASFILETDDIKVYPNPVYLEKIEGEPVLNFIAIPEDKKGNLYIYDLGGDLIYQSSLKYQSHFAWDLCNNRGLRVSSGMYFYVIRMGSYLKKGKFGIIN